MSGRSWRPFSCCMHQHHCLKMNPRYVLHVYCVHLYDTQTRSIRAEGEAYGICKIKPPAGWKPPFAQSHDTFKFGVKKQDLSVLEGKGRLRCRFEQALRKFLFAIGKPMPSVKGKGM